MIRAYQILLSPLLGQHCRFYPSCSQYTLEAIQEWGLVKGIWLGTKRISRCHPLNEGGIDPVPKRNSVNNGDEELVQDPPQLPKLDSANSTLSSKSNSCDSAEQPELEKTSYSVSNPSIHKTPPLS